MTTNNFTNDGIKVVSSTRKTMPRTNQSGPNHFPLLIPGCVRGPHLSVCTSGGLRNVSGGGSRPSIPHTSTRAIKFVFQETNGSVLFDRHCKTGRFDLADRVFAGVESCVHGETTGPSQLLYNQKHEECSVNTARKEFVHNPVFAGAITGADMRSFLNKLNSIRFPLCRVQKEQTYVTIASISNCSLGNKTFKTQLQVTFDGELGQACCRNELES